MKVSFYTLMRVWLSVGLCVLDDAIGKVYLVHATELLWNKPFLVASLFQHTLLASDSLLSALCLTM